MLVPFPFAYLIGSALLDLWGKASGRWRCHQTAQDLNTLGLASAVAAAVPGAIDYLLVVPPRSSGRERATKHLLLNVSALSLFALARAGRRGEDPRPAAWAVAIEAAAAGLLGAGGWLGGTLMVRNQIGIDHRYASAGKWQVATIDGAPGEQDLDVGAEDDLQPDQMKLLRIGTRRVVLARTERGYVAFDDRCTHRGGPLSDGVLACDVVQCPWHGSQFDVRTGAVRRGPAEESIATYVVEVRVGRIRLRVPPERLPAAQSAMAPQTAGA